MYSHYAAVAGPRSTPVGAEVLSILLFFDEQVKNSDPRSELFPVKLVPALFDLSAFRKIVNKKIKPPLKRRFYKKGSINKAKD